MKAVLDTNVLISGVISTGVTHDVLLRGFRGEYDFIVRGLSESHHRH